MKRISFILALVIGLIHSQAAIWQWSVPVTEWVSNETGRNPEAFLWVPENCDSIKAVMFAFQNMNEETLFEMESWRKHMADMDVAIVWIAPGFGQEWDVSTGCQKAFDKILEDLSKVSGYDEIATAPLIPFGHSAQATMPWNFAAWNPERTLCVISYHGDSPRTNLCGYGRANVEWGRERNIDGIPGLMIEGEYEWWYDRVRPSLAFRMMYPKSCISFLGDTGRGHFDVSEETADYMARFIEKSFEYRLLSGNVNGNGPLVGVDPQKGWLAQQWMPEQTKRNSAAPFGKYKGDPHEAFWYFDQEMAQLTEKRYADTAGKKPTFLQFVQNGSLLPYDENLHVRVRGEFSPEDDGITYYLKAVYTDSTRTTPTDNHPDYTPIIRKVCGPVKVVNDTTFRVDFNCTGMDNPRRTWDMTLCAEAPSDKNYKGAVQQIEIKLPHRITNGKRQAILFPSIDDIAVSSGIKEIELEAVSDSGLPVSYYVKEGPVYITEDGGKLILAPIPPKAKMPMKVTVVAWQFGKEGQVQTADPVERTFFITK